MQLRRLRKKCLTHAIDEALQEHQLRSFLRRQKNELELRVATAQAHKSSEGSGLDFRLIPHKSIFIRTSFCFVDFL